MSITHPFIKKIFKHEDFFSVLNLLTQSFLEIHVFDPSVFVI